MFVHDAFISYSRSDARLAILMKREFMNAGLSVWMDESELRAGQPLRGSITDAIQLSKHVCLLLSRSALQSSWVQDEIAIALEQEATSGNQKLIPAKIDDVEIPELLKGRLCVDLSLAARFEQNLDRLVDALGGRNPHSVSSRKMAATVLADFAETALAFQHLRADRLDILLANGGATIPGIVVPYAKAVLTGARPAVRAVFLDLDGGEALEGYQFDDGSRYSNAGNRGAASRHYEALLWNSGGMQNIGAHRPQLRRSIEALRGLRAQIPGLELDIRLSPCLPFCRLIMSQRSVIYTPLLHSPPYMFRSLLLNDNSALEQGCRTHFERVFAGGRPVPGDRIGS